MGSHSSQRLNGNHPIIFIYHSGSTNFSIFMDLGFYNLIGQEYFQQMKVCKS